MWGFNGSSKRSDSLSEISNFKAIQLKVFKGLILRFEYVSRCAHIRFLGYDWQVKRAF